MIIFQAVMLFYPVTIFLTKQKDSMYISMVFSQAGNLTIENYTSNKKINWGKYVSIL